MSSRWWLPVLDNPTVAAQQLPYEIIVVGCSLGGMHALEVILNALPRNFCVPIAVVQHRHRASNETLPSHFRQFSRLPVVDVDDKQWIRPGTVYLAPANYHLLVERGEFSLSVDEKVRYSRPSVDVLFQSAADAYGDRVIAVVLTGANDDGAEGVRRVKARGGIVIVQDPATAEAPEMPRAAIAAAPVDRILPLDQIASYLVDRCTVPRTA
jgi:two-component system, chemotaxis family, protein-glutamate methylesterase/glutaminase